MPAQDIQITIQDNWSWVRWFLGILGSVIAAGIAYVAFQKKKTRL